MITLGWYDSSRSRSDRAEKPENTVLNSAPIRKQASTATTASLRFGVKMRDGVALANAELPAARSRTG